MQLVAFIRDISGNAILCNYCLGSFLALIVPVKIGVKDFFQTAQGNNFRDVNYDYHEEINKGYGRTETRRYWVSDCIDSIKNSNGCKGLNIIGMVEASTMR